MKTNLFDERRHNPALHNDVSHNNNDTSNKTILTH